MKHEILDINSIIFQKNRTHENRAYNKFNSTEFNGIYLKFIKFLFPFREDLSLNIIILCQENVCFQGKTKDFLTVDRNARC